MKISIIIVSWNSLNYLRGCINSLKTSIHHKTEIIVVDNNSVDGTKEYLSACEHVVAILNDQNYGFAKAINQGLKRSTGDFINILNPDTEINYDPYKILIEAINSNQADLIGIKQLDSESNIQRSCCRKPKLSNLLNEFLFFKHLPFFKFQSFKMEDWAHDSTRYVFHVIGSFMFFKRELLTEVGLFDEKFFLYYEDFDFCTRLHELNKKVLYINDISIMHVGGGTSKAVPVKRLVYSIRSRLLYLKKHLSKSDYIILMIVLLFIHPLLRILYNIFRLNFKEIRNTVLAYYEIYSNK